MSQNNIESALRENRHFPPPGHFAVRARLRAAQLEAMRRHAAADHTGFWADLARSALHWYRPFTVTLDDSMAPNTVGFLTGS